MVPQKAEQSGDNPHQAVSGTIPYKKCCFLPLFHSKSAWIRSDPPRGSLNKFILILGILCLNLLKTTLYCSKPLLLHSAQVCSFPLTPSRPPHPVHPPSCSSFADHCSLLLSSPSFASDRVWATQELIVVIENTFSCKMTQWISIKIWQSEDIPLHWDFCIAGRL